MTAQALQQAGLYLGEQLTPADPSNADGHFEDLETVAVHDQWLSNNHSHWCHVGQRPSVDSSEASVAIQAIAKRLSIETRSWGVKDPRACLFLPYWFDELDSLCGVFTYRHFASCYESLQRRHGIDLLLKPTLPKPNSRIESIDLFSDPSLALASWLAYNKVMLSQIKRSPERCILVSQQALVSGYRLVQDVNHKFSTNLNEAADLRIDHSKVSAQQNILLPGIEQKLIEELHQVWEELQQYSVAKAVEEPSITWAHETERLPIQPSQSEQPDLPMKNPIDRVTPYWDKMGLRVENSTEDGADIHALHTTSDTDHRVDTRNSNSESTNKSESNAIKFNSINFVNRAEVNRAIRLTPNLNDQKELIETGLLHYPQSAFLHGLMGKCLFNLKQWSDAIVHLDIAASMDTDDPSVHFHTALWHIEHKNIKEAIWCVQLALSLNRNADHMILLINLKMQESAFEEAKRFSLLGYDWFPKDERFVLLHADALLANQQVHKAIDWCKENDSSKKSYAISNKLYALYSHLGDSINTKWWNTESQRRKLHQFKNYRHHATAVLNTLKSDYARSSLTNIWCDALHAMTTSKKSAAVSVIETLPKVAMSILVRDEVDIIESNIRFHAQSGVTHFIVTDNASVDGTRDVLSSLTNEFSLDIIDEPSHTIDQDLWVTRMAQQLQLQGKFDWIIHNDADEFWVPRAESIPKAIQQALKSNKFCGDQIGVLACRRLNMLTAKTSVQLDDYAFHDNIHAAVQDVPLQPGEQPWSDSNSNCVARLVMDKVLTRAAGLNTVEYGNHGAEHALKKTECDNIQILHFPVRNYAQFERKVRNYGEALENNTRFSAGSSLHLRYWYKRYLEGNLELDYEHLVFDTERLQSLLEMGAVRIDSRVSDFFKTTTLGLSEQRTKKAA